PFQSFEPVSGRKTKVIQNDRRPHLTQLAQRDPKDPRIDRTHALTTPQPLGVFVAERPDHRSSA
ncbi:MAG: hypothetical protein QM607_01600, partial [Microbacterium sp.]